MDKKKAESKQLFQLFPPEKGEKKKFPQTKKGKRKATLPIVKSRELAKPSRSRSRSRRNDSKFTAVSPLFPLDCFANASASNVIAHTLFLGVYFSVYLTNCSDLALLKSNLLLNFCSLICRIGGSQGAEKRIGRRALLSFKETPPGSNTTYDCGPSGPCVPCLYSEKVLN